MQAPIEVSRREGEVFLLDILSHRMSAIADYNKYDDFKHTPPGIGMLSL